MADRNLCENCFSKLADHERKMYVGVNNMIPSSLTGDGAPTKTEAHTPTQCSKASFRKPSTPPIEETEPPTAGTADGTAAAFLSNIQKHHQQAAAPPQQVVPRQQPAKVNPAASHSEDEGIPFNPYLFMKLLPPYNDIRKRCDIVLPVKSKGDSRKTLVLDLDETLVHCSVGRMDNADLRFPVQFNGVEYEINARKRPHMVEFLDCVSQHFEVVVFTASQEVYARRLLDLIDPEGKYVHHRLYRDSCMPVCGNYLKDLNCLGRDLSQVLLVDNSPHAFGYQVDNGVPIMSWFDDTSDKELLSLLPFLDRILGAEDVRIPIRNQFKTQAIINEQQEVGYGQHTRADLHGSV
jgi:CTD small phosphatase-like protein 2